jgi:threonine/homoserine/homoserine lactone efflux protein
MGLLFFLFQVFVISFSGAMQPGPVTATAIAIGGRNRYAGTLIALGHAIIELPLMVLIMFGIGKVFKSPKFQIAIGLAGGIVLLIMAITMLISLKVKESSQEKNVRDKPVLAGLILSATNPYFLLWWATIGLALATTAKGFGIWAFALFALVHWFCDCLWLQALSWASFKGSSVLGPHRQRIVLMICSLALLLFGLMFIYHAARNLFKLF